MNQLKEKLKDIRFKKSYFEIKDHIVYEVCGADCEQYFSNQLTSNTKILKSNHFQESAITDAKGRLVCSFLILKENSDKFHLSFDSKYENELIERLNLFLISEDVEFIKTDKSLKVALNHLDDLAFKGNLFDGINCSISLNKFDLPLSDPYLLKLLRFSSGKALMGTHIEPKELITNTYLTEYAVDFNKGCYPGQETVSKIYNNKGASQFPVVLVGNEKLDNCEIRIDGKKIGNIKESLQLDDLYLHYVSINRENRVEGKSLVINDNKYDVYNFPLLSNKAKDLVVEIFDQAVESFQVGKDEEAKEYLRLAIELDPSYSDAYESLGVILGREKKFEDAIEVMKKLIEVEPATVMGRTNLSMYYMQLGDKETAEMYKGEATLKQFEQFGIEADKKRAVEESEKQKKLEKKQRESMFKQVLEIDSEDALANFGLGELELERLNYDSSIDHLNKAIKADNKYSVAYLALGKAYLGNKNSDKARETFQNGIEIASKNGDLMPANEMQSLLNNI